MLKIQKNPKFLEFPKFQKSKNPNPSFGFLETRGICSKSKKPKIPRVSKIPKIQKFHPKVWIFRNSSGSLEIQKTPNSSSFQNSKNPKTPTPVSDFWKLEEFAQNPKKPKIPRVSKIPKIQKSQPQFRIFGNSVNFGFFWILSKFLEFPKTRNWGWDFWISGIFGNSRNFGAFGF